MRSRNILELESVCHAFNGKTLLNNVSFGLQQGQILCILGPSGSGKSTLLKIIAGLIKPILSGRVILNGKDQAKVPTYQREIGFVFQTDDALFPHLTVYENVAFPFSKGNRKSDDINWKNDVLKILELVGLESYAKSGIKNLSGGERQRIALARALVYKPPLLLLDEPLNSLDNIHKKNFLQIMQNLQKNLGTTLVYVTHDEREALEIATHIGVLHDKKLQQVSTVDDVLRTPATPKIAEIIGGWNLIKCSLNNSNRTLSLFDMCDIPLNSNKQIIGEYSTVGIPITKTKLEQALPSSLGPNDIAVPVTVQRIQEWHYSRRCTCLSSQGHLFYSYIDQSISDDTNKGIIIFSKEDIHVF